MKPFRFCRLNHVYEQIFDLMMHMRVGHIVNFTENTDTVMNDLRNVSPTLFHAVPRIWEKYHSAIVLKMADATWLKRTIFNIAFKIGSKYNTRKLAKKSMPFYLFIAYWIAYFSCILEAQGTPRLRPGEARYFPVPRPSRMRFLNFSRASASPSVKDTG